MVPVRPSAACVYHFEIAQCPSDIPLAYARVCVYHSPRTRDKKCIKKAEKASCATRSLSFTSGGWENRVSEAKLIT